MRERRMVDRARDRLVVTAALLQRLHDDLRFGLLRPAQAEAATALILAQLKQAVTLVDDASRSLRDAHTQGDNPAMRRSPRRWSVRRSRRNERA